MALIIATSKSEFTSTGSTSGIPWSSVAVFTASNTEVGCDSFFDESRLYNSGKGTLSLLGSSGTAGTLSKIVKTWVKMVGETGNVPSTHH